MPSQSKEALLASGYAEECPACGGVSAYAWDDVDEEKGIAHIPAASAFEWTCGHCGRGWTPKDSPISAEVYTHRAPEEDMEESIYGVMRGQAGDRMIVSYVIREKDGTKRRKTSHYANLTEWWKDVQNARIAPEMIVSVDVNGQPVIDWKKQVEGEPMGENHTSPDLKAAFDKGEIVLRRSRSGDTLWWVGDTVVDKVGLRYVINKLWPARVVACFNDDEYDEVLKKASELGFTLVTPTEEPSMESRKDEALIDEALRDESALKKLCRTYGVRGFYDDGAGLIGVKSKYGVDWYKWQVKAGRYLMTGSTNTAGKGVSYHSCESEKSLDPVDAFLCEALRDEKLNITEKMHCRAVFPSSTAVPFAAKRFRMWLCSSLGLPYLSDEDEGGLFEVPFSVDSVHQLKLATDKLKSLGGKVGSSYSGESVEEALSKLNLSQSCSCKVPGDIRMVKLGEKKYKVCGVCGGKLEVVESLEEAYKELLPGNWKEFRDFAWHDQPEDADNWAIFYTAGRDTQDAVVLANAEEWKKILAPFMEGDDPDVREEHHGHWASGWIDGYAVRMIKDGEETEAAKTVQDTFDRLEEYPALDDEAMSRIENEQALEYVKYVVSSGDLKEGIPEDWASKALEWMYRHGDVEVVDGEIRGGEEKVIAALKALGFLDPDYEQRLYAKLPSEQQAQEYQQAYAKGEEEYTAREKQMGKKRGQKTFKSFESKESAMVSEDESSSFNIDSEEWFDKLAGMSPEEKESDPALRNMFVLSKGTPNMRTLWGMLGRAVDCKDTGFGQKIIEFGNKIINGKYKTEFKNKEGPGSQIAEFLSLFRQAFMYSFEDKSPEEWEYMEGTAMEANDRVQPCRLTEDDEETNEAFDKIVEALKKAGIEASYRFFDKYQGYFIQAKTQKGWEGEFYVDESFYTGEKVPSGAKYKKAVLYDEEGNPQSANRGDYFQVKPGTVIGSFLSLQDMQGKETRIDNPTVEDLPDLADVERDFQYKEGTAILNLVFMERSDPGMPLVVTVPESGEPDVSELVAYMTEELGEAKETIKHIGSQNRERIEDTDYELVKLRDGKREAILRDKETGKIELWVRNDHFAGYVVEIDGVGYEFVSSKDLGEARKEKPRGRVKDQYGKLVPVDDLVLLPDIGVLSDEEIEIVDSADWYEVDGILLAPRGQLGSLEGFGGLSGGDPEDAGLDLSAVGEISRVADSLKRWSKEDGFYHA